jgi:hypothetical protein
MEDLKETDSVVAEARESGAAGHVVRDASGDHGSHNLHGRILGKALSVGTNRLSAVVTDTGQKRSKERAEETQRRERGG